MKKIAKILINRKTVSKIQTFDWSKVKGGQGAATPPVNQISVNTYLCAVSDNL